MSEKVYEARIARGEFVCGHFVSRRPSECCVLETHWLAPDIDGEKCNDEWRVGIGGREECVSNHRHLDAEFLGQLSRDRLRVGLTGFALAAGKLPAAAMALMGRTLAYQEPVAITNHRRDHTLLNSCHSSQNAFALTMPPGSEACS